jgi:hypothetical protein
MHSALFGDGFDELSSAAGRQDRNVRFSPRISPRLLDAVEGLAVRRIPIAEINRLLGAEAARLGLPKPSYERVRQLVHEARDLQRNYTSAAQILLEIATLQRSPRSAEKLATLPPRPRLRDKYRK